MDLNTYQTQAYAHAVYPSDPKTGYLTIAIIGECGELANLFKKELRSGNINKEKIISELGDILWYLAALATEGDRFTLEDIRALAYSKLQRHNRPASMRKIMRDLSSDAAQLDRNCEISGIHSSLLLHYVAAILENIFRVMEVYLITLTEVCDYNLNKLSERSANGTVVEHKDDSNEPA